MNQYNFDHPDAFDFSLLIETLRKLKEGKRVEVPIYSFTTHTRESRMVCRFLTMVFQYTDNMLHY